MKGKRYKVAFSIVLFQCYFNQHIVFNSFKINTFSLIPYSLTLTILTLTPYPFSLIKTQTPQPIRISPASATGFWNELYFYRANFIFLESTLFDLYRSKLYLSYFTPLLLILPDSLAYLCHSLCLKLHSRPVSVMALLPILVIVHP